MPNLYTITATAVAFSFAGLNAEAGDAEHKFNVIGTWSSLSPYQNYEEPFWTEYLQDVSHGRLDADLNSMSTLGVKGYETVSLLKRGVFDFGHATIAYVTGNVPEMEGIDLAGVATDMASSRRNAEAYKETVNAHLLEKEGVVMLAVYPFSSQYIFCKDAIVGLEDLKGKKIRSSSATHADFITGAGATNVTIPFAEVVPALQKGVVDCAVTGSMSAYGANWAEVVDAVYALPLNMGLSAMFVGKSAWDALDDATREQLNTAISSWEDSAWAGLAEEDANGLSCLVGDDNCTAGKAVDLKLIEPTDKDIQQLERILRTHVFANWIERCGEDCAEVWNNTVGQVAGFQIEK